MQSLEEAASARLPFPSWSCCSGGATSAPSLLFLLLEPPGSWEHSQGWTRFLLLPQGAFTPSKAPPGTEHLSSLCLGTL